MGFAIVLPQTLLPGLQQGKLAAGAARRRGSAAFTESALLKPGARPDRRLFASSCRCSPPCGGAQIIYSAAGGLQSGRPRISAWIWMRA